MIIKTKKLLPITILFFGFLLFGMPKVFATECVGTYLTTGTVQDACLAIGGAGQDCELVGSNYWFFNNSCQQKSVIQTAATSCFSKGLRFDGQTGCNTSCIDTSKTWCGTSCVASTGSCSGGRIYNACSGCVCPSSAPNWSGSQCEGGGGTTLTSDTERLIQFVTLIFGRTSLGATYDADITNAKTAWGTIQTAWNNILSNGIQAYVLTPKDTAAVQPPAAYTPIKTVINYKYGSGGEGYSSAGVVANNVNVEVDWADSAYRSSFLDWSKVPSVRNIVERIAGVRFCKVNADCGGVTGTSCNPNTFTCMGNVPSEGACDIDNTSLSLRVFCQNSRPCLNKVCWDGMGSDYLMPSMISTWNPDSSFGDMYGKVNQVLTLKGTSLKPYWQDAPSGMGVFVGLSPSPFDGNRSGYSSANNNCYNGTGVLAGSHICTASEIINSYNKNISLVTTQSGKAWINNGPPGYISNVVNDCNGWSSNNSAIFGSIWLFDTYDKSLISPCNQTLQFACCK